VALTYSEPGYNLHEPSEICTDNFTADRSPTGMYRTAPLRGCGRAKGGYYHEGRYPNLTAVVDHYNSCFNLGLSSGQKADLVQFLRSP
jgi:cytochrome c peroxidase